MSARTTTLHRPTLPAHRQSGLFTKIANVFAVYSERRRLADLPDYRLADLGITRAQATQEARREIWDVPAGWTR